MKKTVLLLVLITLFLVLLIGCTPGGTPDNTPDNTLDNMPNNTTEAINGLYNDDKDELFCIIHGTTITVSKKTKASAISASSILSNAFEFTLDDGTYNGSNEGKTISFRLNGDRLYLNLDDKTYSLLLDRSVLFDEKFVELNKPKNINAEASQIFWYWISEESDNLYGSGIMSACIRITSAENELVKCEYLNYIPEPASMFSYDLRNAKLAPGEYKLSVEYVGGIYVNNGFIYQSLDSEPEMFSLTVTDNNEYLVLLGG